MANVPVETNMTSEIDDVYRKADSAFKSPLATAIESDLAGMARSNAQQAKRIGAQSGAFVPLDIGKEK